MARFLKSITVIGVAGLLMIAGCANGELARKEKELADLGARWRRAERELAKSLSRISKLRKELAQAKSTAEKTQEALNRSTEALKKSQVEQARLAAKMKGLEEKNYDLEMAYGNLTEQVNELKKRVAEETAKLERAKQVILKGKEEIRDLEGKHARALDQAHKETEAARSEARKLKGALSALEGKVKELKGQLAFLEKEAAAVPGLRQEANRLKIERSKLKFLNEKAATELKTLRGQLADLAEVAQAAGVAIPSSIEAPEDWDVMRRMAQKRFRQFLAGKPQGDTVDMILFGTVALLFVLFLVAGLTTVSALRSKRKLRAVLSGGDLEEEESEEVMEEEEEEYYEDEDQSRGGGAEEEYDEEEVPPQAVEDASARGTKRRTVWKEGETEPPRRPVRVTESPKTAAAPTVSIPASGSAAEGEDTADDHEMTEVLAPIAADRPELRPGPAAGRPEGRSAAAAGSGDAEAKKPSPKGKEDDDLLGDLRQMINKKFDELLEG